jgi:NAD(P)-dependent dehydrogenase (short-subunit alcohol dehydrogenase family)
MEPTGPRGEVTPGTVVLVTGGARGIGAGLSRHLAAQGAAVVTADVVEATGETDGLDITHLRADVSDEASWRELVAATLERHGRIDALVNNAAIYQGLGVKRPFTDISVQEWDRVMAVNTRGVWLGIRAVHPVMAAQGRGRVVNIASSTVHAGVPWFAHYTASKGAVIALTRSIAREVGADGWSRPRPHRPSTTPTTWPPRPSAGPSPARWDPVTWRRWSPSCAPRAAASSPARP